MIRTIFALTLLFATSVQVHAQDFVIPLHIHDAGLLQPDGALASRRYLEVSVESANRWFEDAGVCFFVQAHQPFPARETYEVIRRELPRTPAVHAAIVRQVSNRGRQVNGVATRGGTRATLALSRLRADRFTMAHELGHVLGLTHSESGVMRSSGRDWWDLDEEMTRTEIRTVRENARAFVARHENWPRRECLRHSVPEPSEIGPDDSLLLRGARTYSNGARYEGSLLFGRRHGLGTHEYADGSTYQGMWALGERHGQGTHEQGRRRYVGDWANDRRQGHGLQVYRNGTEYEGAFVRGQRHGLGEHRFRRGRYRGNWHRGERSGFGEYIFPNGDRHVGQWRGGRRHGFGTHRFNRTGRRLIGEWRNGDHTSTSNMCSR
ncbi:MAG: hypothetical protein AB8H86_33480 [Polyangiales bacterium]